MQKKTAGA